MVVGIFIFPYIVVDFQMECRVSEYGFDIVMPLLMFTGECKVATMGTLHPVARIHIYIYMHDIIEFTSHLN